MYQLNDHVKPLNSGKHKHKLTKLVYAVFMKSCSFTLFRIVTHWLCNTFALVFTFQKTENKETNKTQIYTPALLINV